MTRPSDPNVSAWVKANAGTGKTHVLTQRVIRLLLADTPPERILCLTFTKAAAAQMQNRLFETLGLWATHDDKTLAKKIEAATGEDADDNLALARRLFARAIETPGGLKIQTIHAFCERLLGRFPLEAGVPPHFVVLDERTSAELVDDAEARVLDEATRDDALGKALATIVAQASEEGFAKIMREIVAKRGPIARMFAGHGGWDGTLASVAAMLGLHADANEDAVTRQMCDDVDTRRADIVAAEAALGAGSSDDTKRAATLRVFLETSDPAARVDAYFDTFLKQDGREPRKRVITKKTAEDHPDAETFLNEEQARAVASWSKLCAVRVLVATQAVLTVAERFVTLYDSEKERRSGLDYDDLIFKARDLLLKSDAAAWVHYKLDGGIDHVLVDEAQDTSPEQWDVIAALTVEFFAGLGAREDRNPEITRTVFAVGDEKQSIFSFQGADPAKFHEMENHFQTRTEAAGQAWNNDPLSLSFRSTEVVLETVDRLFAQPDIARALTPSGEIVKHRAKRAGEAGRVELWPIVRGSPRDDHDPWDAPLDQESEATPRGALAARIVTTIKRWIDDKEILVSRDRPIKPGDIMILVRRRDALAQEIIRQLKKARVPVAGADRMVLTEEMAVMDLMALGAFALLSHDDLTLAVVLKSPLVGLSEEELFEVAHGREGSLWRALTDRARAGPASIFARAHGALSHVLARVDVTPPYDFYQEILDQPFAPDLPGGASGRARLLQRLGRDAEDPINEFVSLALAYEKVAVPSLQGFLHWLRQGQSELKREHDQARDEVRVMTVHGAKGLESEIVMLPDTCGMPNGRHDPKLIEVGGVMVWPVRKENDTPAMALARSEIAADRQAEYHRLLYVAATRARDRLYVAGHLTKGDPAAESWYALAHAAIQPHGRAVALPSGEDAWRVDSAQKKPVRREQPTEKGAGDSSLPAWVKTIAAPERARAAALSPSALYGADEPAVLSPIAAGDRFQRGLLIHKLFEVLPALGKDHRLAVARMLMRRAAPTFDEAATEELIAEVLAVLDHADFAPLFGPASRAEVALAGRPYGLDVSFSGQVDRLVVMDNDVLIVDYKTNRPVPATPRDVSPLYLRQMAVYRNLIRMIYPQREVRCALLWTDGPRLMALPDALLDEVVLHLAEGALLDGPKVAP